MDADNLALASCFISQSYIAQGAAALTARRRLIKQLLSNRRLPAAGWDEATVEVLLQDAALMDSNTFPGQVGLGEREGRVACPLVSRMHARLAHGIGRSGDIAAEQPKAAGSSLLAKLAAHLAADALQQAGLQGLSLPVILPCATGMALTLVMLAAAAAAAAANTRQQQQCSSSSSDGQPPALRRYVIWSRIDQKTCLKSITAANLIPVVIELKRHNDELVTDVAAVQAAVVRLGPDNVAAVVTTTSCFAPRSADDVVSVAKLCQAYGVSHIINNAYGVQARALTAAVTAACRKGRVDAIVQSTDKNFMVPVGGSIIAAPAGKGRDWLIQAVAKNYPGRAAMTAHLDLLLTLLHWGAAGWSQVLDQREELYEYLKSKLTAAAEQVGERVLVTPGNPISLGFTLDGLAAAAAAANKAAAAAAVTASLATRVIEDTGIAALQECKGNDDLSSGSSSSSKRPDAAAAAAAVRADVSFFGSMLWARNVSGTRVLTSEKQQTVGGITFDDYGCHTKGYPHPYLTAAAALGTTQHDVDIFVERLVKAYRELQRKWSKAAEGAAVEGVHASDTATAVAEDAAAKDTL